MTTGPFREGEILRGKYRVKRLLGEGGMGIVVLARHLRLDRNVAIKMLSDEAAAKSGAVVRFAREARAAARIQSDHVVRILDVDDSESGAPFLVMEYLEGKDLDAVLRDEGKLSVARAVDVVLQACVGLAEAHAHGIVHRDLKPANLFLANRPGSPGIVKVLDFGISKALRDTDDVALGATGAERALGSPSYMSPEQLKSARHVDARTDIWSLGVTLHELVSGGLPFEAEGATALGARIATEPPIPLGRACPDAPKELEAIVLRCLEKDPAARFENVAELAKALAPVSKTGAATAERVHGILFAARLSSARQPIASPSQGPDPRTLSLDAPLLPSPIHAAFLPAIAPRFSR